MIQSSPEKDIITETTEKLSQESVSLLRRSSRVKHAVEDCTPVQNSAEKTPKPQVRRRQARKCPDKFGQRRPAVRRQRRTFSSPNLQRVHNTRASNTTQNREIQHKKERFPYETFLYSHLPKCSFGYIPVYKNYSQSYPEKPCYICGDTPQCPHSLENLGFTSSLSESPYTRSETTIMYNFISAVRRWKQQKLATV